MSDIDRICYDFYSKAVSKGRSFRPKFSMNPTLTPVQRLQIECLSWPLAVYRELATHLRQLEGVSTGLIPPQSSVFRYEDSQVGGLWIEYSPTTDPQICQRVQTILAYYGQRYGTFASKSVPPSLTGQQSE